MLRAINELSFETRPIPKLSSDFDVLLAPKFTGICGSDVHYWTHGGIGQFVVNAPMVLGHESSGTILAIGSAVTTLKVGDRVAMEPGVPCWRCTECKRGLYNICPNTRFAATPPIDGTLARYYVLPADLCYKLPAHVSLEEGALMEPLAVAVHVIRQAEVKPGHRVVIFGAGPVGLLCLAVARAFGATTLVTVDINAQRVKFAREYAATAEYTPRKEDSPEQSAKRLVEECFEGGNGADVAIDATGAEACIRIGVHVLRRAGTYVQAGMGKPDVSWPMFAMMAKELNVKASFRYKHGDYDLAVELVSSGKLDVKSLITSKFSFKKAEQAFEDTKAGKGIKILIEGPMDSDE